jgi:hypothetical protein
MSTPSNMVTQRFLISPAQRLTSLLNRTLARAHLLSPSFLGSARARAGREGAARLAISPSLTDIDRVRVRSFAEF